MFSRCRSKLSNVGVSRRAIADLVFVAASSPGLREFSNRPVNGQRWFRIWFFCFTFYGFSHYWPPHECYIEFRAPTATKC